METNATRMCGLLVGLPDVNVLAVDDQPDAPIVVHVEVHRDLVWCRACGVRATVKERPHVELIDLPCFGRPARLVWRKQRWRCPEPACEMGSWTIVDTRIAAPRMALTDWAARWATVQVGRLGRSVNEIAEELGCDWHTVNDTILAYGEALLEADTERVGEVDALGLDETLFNRTGQWRTQQWCTSIVNVGAGQTAQLIDIVPGRSATKVLDWLEDQPAGWKQAIRWGVLDLSGPYRKVFNDGLGHVTQVADPFHLCKRANDKLDECRRRVPPLAIEDGRTTRSTGLVGCSPRPTNASTAAATRSCAGCWTLAIPAARCAWPGTRRRPSAASTTSPTREAAYDFVAQFGLDLQDGSCPGEMRSLGRTLRRWLDQITAWHQARVSNGPTEAINNLIKRIKRIGFGFRRLRNYRIRALLYAGRPNWNLLATVEPR